MQTLEIGRPVPIFQVQDSNGQIVSPDRLLGKPYVLYFYPKSDTPGCTQQACDLRDVKSELDQLNARVIGISPDSETAHDKFMRKYMLNFTLIPDPKHKLCNLFQVLEERKIADETTWSLIRTTFVVDAKGIIRWIEKPVEVKGHAQRVLQALHSLPPASDAL